MKIKRVQAKVTNVYTCRLAGCGINQHLHDYSRLRDVNILQMAVRLLEQVVPACVDPKHQASFYYDLACYLISRLKFVRDEFIHPDIADVRRRETMWGPHEHRNRYARNSKLEWMVEETCNHIRKLPNAKSADTRRAAKNP